MHLRIDLGTRFARSGYCRWRYGWPLLCCCFLLLAGCMDLSDPSIDPDPDFFGLDDIDRGALNAILSEKPPKGHVRVTIDTIELEQSSGAANVLYQYLEPGRRVPGGSMGGQNGVGFYACRPGIEQALRHTGQTRQSQTLTRQFLVLQEESEGQFSVIQQRPVLWTVRIPVYRGTVLAYWIDEQITGTGMHVRLGRISDGAVSLTLTPFLRKARGRGVVEVIELQTTVRLTSGQPYAMMSQDRATSSSFGGAFFSTAGKTGRSRIAQIVTAHIGE